MTRVRFSLGGHVFPRKYYSKSILSWHDVKPNVFIFVGHSRKQSLFTTLTSSDLLPRIFTFFFGLNIKKLDVDFSTSHLYTCSLGWQISWDFTCQQQVCFVVFIATFTWCLVDRWQTRGWEEENTDTSSSARSNASIHRSSLSGWKCPFVPSKIKVLKPHWTVCALPRYNGVIVNTTTS